MALSDKKNRCLRARLRVGLTFLASVIALLTAPFVATNAAELRPNILLIVADDLGYGDVGFLGCRDIPTPHIDSIAAQGVRFTDGYVTAPVCSPSRAGLFTLRYQQRFGHEFNPGPRQADDLAEGGLPLSELTLAERLQKSGYATGIVGKWHLGEAKPMRPLKRGFDEFYGFLGANHPYFPAAGSDVFRNNQKIDAPPHLTIAFGQQAAKFIRGHAVRPFFLYLAFNAPHNPLQPAKEHLTRVAGIADEQRRKFAGLVCGMDDAIGQALGALKDTGVDENTLVIFLSDNGGPQANNGSSNRPLRGDKLTLWEGGIRVPMAMRWRTRIPAGATYREPIISLDVTTTAAAAAGALQDGAADAVDGVDLLPYLTGKTAEPPHDALYWRFGRQHAMRRGDYKLLQFAQGPPRLYDLATDEGEKNDITRVHPDIVKQLEAAYAKWDAALVDPLWKRDKMEKTSTVRASAGASLSGVFY